MKQTKYDISSKIWHIAQSEADGAVRFDLMVLQLIAGRLVTDGRVTVRSMKKRLSVLARKWLTANPEDLTKQQKEFLALVTH